MPPNRTRRSIQRHLVEDPSRAANARCQRMPLNVAPRSIQRHLVEDPSRTAPTRTHKEGPRANPGTFFSGLKRSVVCTGRHVIR